MINAFKWFALIVIFFNFAYFGWSIVSPDDVKPDSASAKVRLEGEQITLLRELDTKALDSLRVQNNEIAGELVEKDASLPASEPYCPSLGPFNSTLQVREAGERLAKSGLGAKARRVVVDSSDKYRVYLEPYTNYETAREALQELRAKKVDSYIMTDAPLANAISLGIFSTLDSAEGLALKMKSYGYSARIQTTTYDKEVFWLDVQSAVQSEKVDQVLSQVMSDLDGITRVDSPCKVVALTE